MESVKNDPHFEATPAADFGDSFRFRSIGPSRARRPDDISRSLVPDRVRPPLTG